jgi:hypothetical protein
MPSEPKMPIDAYTEHEGSFDGTGHLSSNAYQPTWQQHYRDLRASGFPEKEALRLAMQEQQEGR